MLLGAAQLFKPRSLHSIRRGLMVLTVALCAMAAWKAYAIHEAMHREFQDFLEQRLVISETLGHIDVVLMEAMHLARDLRERPDYSCDEALTLAKSMHARLEQTTPAASLWRDEAAASLLRMRSGLAQHQALAKQEDCLDLLEQLTSAIQRELGALRASLRATPAVGMKNVHMLTAYEAVKLEQFVERYLASELRSTKDLTLKVEFLREQLAPLRQAEALAPFAAKLDALDERFATIAGAPLGDASCPFSAGSGGSFGGVVGSVPQLNLWDESHILIHELITGYDASLLRHREAMERSMQEKLMGMLGVLLAGLGACSLAFVTLLRNVSHRLSSLREATGKLTRGEFDHPISRGPDDVIGALGQDFNGMALALQHKEASLQNAMRLLQQSHEVLEDRVRQRTEQLVDAMEGLRLKDSVFTYTKEGILIYDAAFTITDANPAMTAMFGYTLEELRGQSFALLDEIPNDTGLHTIISETLAQHGHWDGELWQRAKHGETLLIWLFITAIRDDRDVTHYVGVFRDMTEHRRNQEQIERQATTDFLTGLPNRAALMEALDAAIDQQNTPPSLVALLFLDLDNFKHINDSLGHASGDVLLQKMAQRLQECVRGDDTVARLGGDEFVVLARRLVSKEQSFALAQRILDVFQRPFTIAGASLRCQCSIGVTFFPQDGVTTETLLRNADLALYKAKAHGKGQFEVYSPDLDEAAQKRIHMEQSLHDGILRREFEVWHQPVVLMQRPQVVGAEALVRWRRDSRLISPADFIPLAEEMNVIDKLTELVIADVGAHVRTWKRAGLSSLHMSINISASMFSIPDFPNHITERILAHGMHPSDISLEITETAIMREPQLAIGMCAALREIGFSIAVDDFGTGHSSLQYLQQFPVSTLKIDKQFVQHLEQKGTENIVRATIAMAKGLGLIVQAEGVETPAQARFLQDHNCDFAQGYLYSKPLPADAFLAYCQSLDASTPPLP